MRGEVWFALAWLEAICAVKTESVWGPVFAVTSAVLLGMGLAAQ